jgi:hypothetical protein
MIYHISKNQITYGITIGILMLDCHIPYIPGMIGNATTFPYPVLYKVVCGASINRLIYERDSALIQPFIEAGRELVERGVKAVTGNCGFMALYQREMAAALDVPVFMSSLLLLPLISRMLKPNEKVGIVTADAARVDRNLLQAVGVDESIGVQVADLKQKPHFCHAILEENGVLDDDLLERESVEVVEDMVKKDSSVKAIVLECTDIPPFANAIQNKVGIPIFDLVSLIDFVSASFTRKAFNGFM